MQHALRAKKKIGQKRELKIRRAKSEKKEAKQQTGKKEF